MNKIKNHDIPQDRFLDIVQCIYGEFIYFVSKPDNPFKELVDSADRSMEKTCLIRRKLRNKDLVLAVANVWEALTGKEKDAVAVQAGKGNCFSTRCMLVMLDNELNMHKDWQERCKKEFEIE